MKKYASYDEYMRSEIIMLKEMTDEGFFDYLEDEEEDEHPEYF